MSTCPREGPHVSFLYSVTYCRATRYCMWHTRHISWYTVVKVIWVEQSSITLTNVTEKKYLTWNHAIPCFFSLEYRLDWKTSSLVIFWTVWTLNENVTTVFEVFTVRYSEHLSRSKTLVQEYVFEARRLYVVKEKTFCVKANVRHELVLAPD